MTSETGTSFDASAIALADNSHQQVSGALGVVIVSYASGDHLLQCLDSLRAANSTNLRILVCDNASQDDTVEKVRRWAKGELDVAVHPILGKPDAKQCGQKVRFAEFSEGDVKRLDAEKLPDVTLIRMELNRGYAGAVNVGLSALMEDPKVDLFWILNPDCLVPASTPSVLRKFAATLRRPGMIGGRLIYVEPHGVIQSDGARVSPWTGRCENLNQGKQSASAPSTAHLKPNFVSGASLVVSRDFVETVGPMSEDYFLYYEEVDWAMRRGSFPIAMCEEAVVYHHGGTTIGTGAVNRQPNAFANYFNYRNRVRFGRRFFRTKLPLIWIYAAAQILSLALKGYRVEAIGALRGLLSMRPPREVWERVSPDSRSIAFGSTRNTE